MTVRTPHSGVAGEVLTAANLAKYPKGWIGYTSTASDQGSITTETTLSGLSTSPTFGAFRAYRIAVVAHVKSATASDRWRMRIKVDGTTVQDFRKTDTVANVAETASFHAIVFAPSAGVAAITVTLELTSGTGALTMEATSTTPATITVEDIGPSS
jgi:hypothetical protein